VTLGFVAMLLGAFIEMTRASALDPFSRSAQGWSRGYVAASFIQASLVVGAWWLLTSFLEFSGAGNVRVRAAFLLVSVGNLIATIGNMSAFEQLRVVEGSERFSTDQVIQLVGACGGLLLSFGFALFALSINSETIEKPVNDESVL
jgi:hypothetical protein